MINPHKICQNIMGFVACLFLAIALVGCTGKVEHNIMEPVQLPATFSQSGSQGLQGKWWLSFNDEELNELIDQALGSNFSLKSSWDRLHQAQAQLAKSSASFFPSLDGEASGGHSADYLDGTTFKDDNLLLGLSASYEVDLWGQIESSVEAARLDMEATQAELDAAAMTLSAEVASSWYLLVQQKSTLSLVDEQLETNSKALDLITTQFRSGQVPIADVLQQRQLIESQKGDKTLLLAQIAQSEHALAILIGEVPGANDITTPAQLISLPELPSTGIPADLIRLRPDIRSAYLEIQAADMRTAVAVADQYPSLRLSASLDTINSSSNTIFSDYLANILAGLTAPLFDGGLRKAEVDRTRAAAAEKLHVYGQTVLGAIGEVEDALIKEQQQKNYIKSLEAQLDLAVKSMEQVKERYLKGVENYQRVLTALTSLQSLQQSMVIAQKDLLLNRIELCRALGTGWDYSTTEKYTQPQIAYTGSDTK